MTLGRGFIPDGKGGWLAHNFITDEVLIDSEWISRWEWLRREYFDGPVPDLDAAMRGLVEARLQAREADAVTNLNERIAASRITGGGYPRSRRHHGAWVDGRARPLRILVNDDPPVLVEVRQHDRRKIGAAVLAATALLAGGLLIFTHPVGSTPSRAEIACNLQKQVDPAYGHVDCTKVSLPNEFKQVTP